MKFEIFFWSLLWFIYQKKGEKGIYIQESIEVETVPFCAPVLSAKYRGHALLVLAGEFHIYQFSFLGDKWRGKKFHITIIYEMYTLWQMKYTPIGRFM